MQILERQFIQMEGKHKMSIAYLQCDLRYNNRLLLKIGGAYVVQITIDRIKKLNCKKIVAGIYACEENIPLIEILKLNGIEIVMSNDDNVNSRFINIMAEEDTDYVIRVGGDQVLFDVERENEIYADMSRQGYEWFMERIASSILPDIVRVDCLRKYQEDILKADRYFMVLEKNMDIKRYKMPYPCIVLYDFRVNSNEGFRICKNIIEKQLNVYELSTKLALSLMYKENYLNRTGIWASWILPDSGVDFFYDENENVCPWLGRSVIDLIKAKLHKELRVFEWGAGNSTLFWSQYVKEVVSIEYNLEWYEKMKEIVPHNVELKYCELEYGGSYSRIILKEQETFDIILVDGRDRVRCAENAVKKLKEDGVIVWDNSEREYYKAGYEFLKSQGFEELMLSSIIYGLPGVEDFTTIFYRENNILGL